MASRIEFKVVMENEYRPFANVFRDMEKANVKIEAISQSDVADCTHFRFVASPTNTARAVLRREGAQFSTRRVLVVRTGRHPHAVAFTKLLLGSRNVEVDYMYSGRVGDRTSTLVVGVSDMERAEHAVSGMMKTSD